MLHIKSKIDTINKLLVNHRIKSGYYAKKGNNSFIIIMYHGIDLHNSTRFNERFFSRDNFEEQIVLLKKHCNILTHTNFMNNEFSKDKTNVAITFDDGYLNNLTYALPILDKYDAHAYYFITGVGSLHHKVLWADAIDIVSRYTKEKSKIMLAGVEFEFYGNEFTNRDSGLNVKKFIKEHKAPGYELKEQFVSQLLSIYDFTKAADLKDYWQLMNDEEIHKTSLSKNITIGSHGFYHNNLGSLSNTDAVEEVKKSKAYLEGIIQKEVTTIGFPDGSYTPQLNESLLPLGFTKQFLVDYKFSDAGNKDYVYDRFGLYPYMGNEHQLLHKIIHQ